MKDEKLETLARAILERGEELGLDSISVTWWIGDKQQERSYFVSPTENAGVDDLVEEKEDDWPIPPVA